MSTTQKRQSDPTKTVPAGALKIPAAVFTFVAKGAADDAGEATGGAFRMVARTSKPVEHWYWGTCYHDLAGMRLSRDRVPIDWLHRDDEVIGYADDFKQERDGDTLGLVATGELVSFADDDRAAEIIHKAGRGVPYEASIDFYGAGIRIEELGQGATAEVNGETVAGPCVIFRDWPLRGIAVCPHGYDQHTSTEFSAGDASAISVTFFKRGQEMTNASKQGGDQADQAAAARATFAETLKQYVERFGSTLGTQYVADGVEYVEALERFADGLVEQLDQMRDDHKRELAELKAKVEAAEARVASLDRGEDTPVPGTTTDERTPAKKVGLGQFIRIGGRSKSAA